MSRICRCSVLTLALLASGIGIAQASTTIEAERECLVQASFAHRGDRDYASKLAIETIDEGPVLAPTLRVRCSKVQDIASFAQSYQLIDEDLEATIAAERQRLKAWNEQYSGEVTDPQRRYQDYLTLDQIRTVVDHWVEEFPEHVELEQIGSSVENRPIRAVHISRWKGDKAPKYRTIILGGHHAREWLAHATTLCITERFIRGLKDPDSRHFRILSNMTLSVIPMGNPDGYVRTHESNRMQRKNANGVDLNRNWDIAWHTQGEADAPPEAENYPGTAAWSEPETAAYRDFIKKYAEGLKGFFDIHAFIPAIMAPYGYKLGKHPRALEYKKAMNAMEDAMQGPGMKRYEMGQINDIVGLASGSSADWVDDATDALSFGTEVRGQSFVVPASEIKPSCDENEAALLAFFETVIPLKQDPDAKDPSANIEDTGPSDNNNDDGGQDNKDGGGNGPTPSVEQGGCDLSSKTSPPLSLGLVLAALLGRARRKRPFGKDDL